MIDVPVVSVKKSESTCMSSTDLFSPDTVIFKETKNGNAGDVVTGTGVLSHLLQAGM